MTIRVPSLTTDGASYLVRAHADGSLSCSCPRYDFAKAPKTCKHTMLLTSALLVVEACGAAGHEAGDGNICLTCVVGLLAASARKVRRLYVPKADVKAKAAAKAAAKRARKTRRATREA